MTLQLDILTLISEGEKLRDRGMKRALDHAEDVHDCWGQKAYNLLVCWLRNKGSGRQFKAEDFRIHCELTDAIDRPPSDRAYGAVVIRAAKAGLIKKIGYATVVNPKAHRTPCTLWEVV